MRVAKYFLTFVLLSKFMIWFTHPKLTPLGGGESRVFADISFLKILNNGFTFGSVRPNCKQTCCIHTSSPGLVRSFPCGCPNPFFTNGWNYVIGNLESDRKLQRNQDPFLFVSSPVLTSMFLSPKEVFIGPCQCLQIVTMLAPDILNIFFSFSLKFFFFSFFIRNQYF